MAERSTGSHRLQKGVSKKACAFLWNESFVWEIMAQQALTAACLPFDLLRSEEIRGGYGDWNMARLP